mgnify:CR=1 FL=1
MITQIESIINNLKKAFKRRFNFLSDIKIHNSHYTDPAKIQENLIAQLTASVRWTQIMKNMIADGATSFLEIGPGKVLQGLLKKVSTEIETNGIQ